jgi:hypothetical protein
MFKQVLDHQGNLFQPAKADELAAKMNADKDDDWTYEVVHCPKGTGLSFIKIFDEENEFIGKV